MKVLVFSSLYPNNMMPNYGVFVKERMSNVAKIQGCSIQVVAPVPYYPPIPFGWRKIYSHIKSEDRLAGVKVYHPRYFMTPKILMSLYGLFMFLSVLPKVKKIKKGFDFDVIDAHYVYPDGLAAILLGQYFNKPVVISARGSDINQYKNFPLIRMLLKYTLRRADRIISVCEALKKEIMRLGIEGDQISVHPNGVDINKFYPIDMVTARETLDLPQDSKIILSVGSLTLVKGFDLLIRALKMLIDDYKETDLYLVIVGEGIYHHELEMLISSLGLDNHVRLVGEVPHNDLYIWYSAADLFCLASSREGWPNVLMESLACGTPAVATSVGGMPEIITSDDIGIVTERTADAMAKGISVAFSKKWNSGKITEYVQAVTWDNVAQSVLRTIETTVINQ